MSIDSGKFCSSLFVKYKNPAQYRNDKLYELKKDFLITPTPEEHIKLMAANTEIAIEMLYVKSFVIIWRTEYDLE